MPASTQAPIRAQVEAAVRAGGMLARAAPLAAALDLAGVVATFPQDTALLVGAALDAEGWRDIGPSWLATDAAAVFAVLDTHYRARRYTLLMAVRAAGPDGLRGPQAFAGGLVGSDAVEVDDQGTPVRTAVLPEPPVGLALMLSGTGKAAPPIYVSTATEAGLWYCAIGSQAEQAVRHALACRRGMEELSVTRSPSFGDHHALVEGEPTLVALAGADGLRAFRYPMPLFEFMSLGQPPALTAVLHVDAATRTARGEIRIHRVAPPNRTFKLPDPK